MRQVLGLKFMWMKPAIEEAAGREEIAIKAYNAYLADAKKERQIEILQESAKKGSESFIESFINRRIFECYQKVGSFKEAVEFSMKYRNMSNESFNIFETTADVAYLGIFEDFENDSQSNLSSTLTQLVISDKGKSNLNLDENVMNIERRLLAELKRENIVVRNMTDIGSDISRLLSDKVAFHCNRQLVNENLLVTSKIVTQLKWGYQEKMAGGVRSSSSILNTLKWSNFTFTENAVELQLLAAKSARKQNNANLALNCLLNYSQSLLEQNVFDLTASQEITANIAEAVPLVNLLEHLSSGPLGENELEKLKVIREGSKLLREFCDIRGAIDVLTRTVQNIPITSNNGVVIAKIFLLLAKYFQLDMRYLEHYEQSALLEFIKRPLTSHSSQVLGCDYLIGDLLAASSDCCQDYAKAWFSLADWYYRRGRKLVDYEIEEVQASPSHHVKQETMNALNLFDVEKPHAFNENAAADFYKNSATGYLKYLSFNGNVRPDRTVQATLRILRLINKHCPETEEILAKGLESTAIDCWHDVIIQLITKLVNSRNDAFAKSIITSLLNRIAAKNPQLVIFQAISSSLINSRENRLLSNLKSIKNDDAVGEKQLAQDDNDSDDDSEEINEKLASDSTFSSIIDFINQSNPQLIAQSVAFITEMRRITVLWDELWLATLLTKQSDLMRKINSLETELNKIAAARFEDKIKHMRAKFSQFLARLLNCLEETRQLTCDSQPETSYEKWFQATFNGVIYSTIDALKSPTEETLLNPKNLAQAYQQLIAVIRKRGCELYSNRSQLIMDTISPILSGLNGSVVPIPGSQHFNVTVQRVNKTVTILHTKTKPKKVCFCGSDGKLRTFLFKGKLM